MDAVRSLVLWIPDWPVVALGLDAAEDVEQDEPVAVLEANIVVACSPAARADGVRRGLRRRDAQARCPQLRVVASDPARDRRVFEPVIALIEELAPGVQPLRPGLCALRARGPARYYGGEASAARTLLAALAAQGLADARGGVADGPFTAEQAARRAPPGDVLLVPAGEAGAFLAPLPVTVLGENQLAELLARLGVRTLGEFAALDAMRVLDRFGSQGARFHALAGGRDSQPVLPRTPLPELVREVMFEPPLELVDHVAFGVRRAADDFIAGLGDAGLVCTELRVELSLERGAGSSRVWLHPGSFDAAGVVDRVRWQVQAFGATGDIEDGGVCRVRILPEAVDAASRHLPPIFGAGTDERVHHALSRVQAMLGHRGVLTPAIGGGRWLAERQVLVPWGDRVVPGKERVRPWPGHLTAPLPATVFAPSRAAEVRDAAGRPVAIDDRDTLSAPPALLLLPAEGRARDIEAWAGPWPLSERGWDASRSRSAHRFQIVDTDGLAWLAVLESGAWSVEGRYD